MRKPIPLPKPTIDSAWDINPNVLIFSDLHLHEREEFKGIDPITGLNTRLAEGLSILDQIIKIVRDHRIPITINLGDVFEIKDRIPNHILIEFKKRYLELSKETYVYSLMGNHDYNLPNYPALELFDIAQFFTTPMFVPNNAGWGFIPFQRSFDDFLAHLQKMNELRPKVIFFHQEIPGAEYESGKKVPGHYLNTMIKPGIFYISGHLHKHQIVNHVVYLGSPYQKSFSDEGTRKFIWLLNSETCNLASMELNYPKFITLSPLGLGADLNHCKGNYVRIKGEVEPSNWTPEDQKKGKLILEGIGAKGISFQVTVKRQHQVKIKEEEVDNDELIIKSYSEENHGSLEQERLYKTGWEIFNQN